MNKWHIAMLPAERTEIDFEKNDCGTGVLYIVLQTEASLARICFAIRSTWALRDRPGGMSQVVPPGPMHSPWM